MQVRGKFFVLGIERSPHSSAGTTIKLGAVSNVDTENAENVMFHKFTPSGTIQMYVDNPSAEAFFTLGKTVYVDFTDAPA